MKYYRLVVILIALAMSCKDQKINVDSIYYGGDIITMSSDNPEYAEAVAVKDGKMVFVGTKQEAMDSYDGVKVNLQGKTLLPGFIDAHGHAFMAGFQSLAANLLPPPDGEGTNVNELIRLSKEWAEDNQTAIGKVGWIIGFGYDDAQLEGGNHPTADQLDEISIEDPVILVHQSGHLAAMNHKALELSSYNDNTANPSGGIIRRVEGTNIPNGVLEEMAMFIPLFSVFDKFDKETNEKIALAGLEAYTKFGFTTAQEGRATKEVTETWRSLAQNKALKIDVVSYPDINKELDYMERVGVQSTYANHFRVGGIKISLDGSPQGKTAWLTEPYKVPPTGETEDYKGYPAFENDDQVVTYLETAYKNNWQVLAHCNGDASGDQYIKALKKASEKYGNKDRRSVMIHAQTVREDQLDDMKELGVIPSFFGMHTFYWGDWHRDETLGKERAYRISPAVSALKRDMVITQHHDAPVALPSAITILHTVVNRTSRSGDVIGADQKLTPYQALKSITSWAAYQYFEEDTKGSLEVGKLADLVILDQNPLTIAPENIIDIQVLETVKEGETVFRK